MNKPTNGNGKSGRPPIDKTPEKDEAVRIALLGHTDVEICRIMDLADSTLFHWKQDDPGFFARLKDAKIKSDTEVVASLRKRALGYDYTTQKVSRDGTVSDITVHVPPDTMACMYWLNNRQPDRWRQRADHTITPGGDWLEALTKYNEIKKSNASNSVEQDATKQPG